MISVCITAAAAAVQLIGDAIYIQQRGSSYRVMHSPPDALADPRLARDDAPLAPLRIANNGHAPVEDGLEQRRGEPAYEQDVVRCNRPRDACRQQQVAVCVLRHRTAPNRCHYTADVVRVRER